MFEEAVDILKNVNKIFSHRSASVLLSYIELNTIVEHMTCKSSQWQCHTGQCIDKDRRCDFLRDCLDGSDEKNCGK